MQTQIIVLMESDYFSSKNAGEESESQPIAAFTSEEDYEKYLIDNGIKPEQFDYVLQYDSRYYSWYHKEYTKLHTKDN